MDPAPVVVTKGGGTSWIVWVLLLITLILAIVALVIAVQAKNNANTLKTATATQITNLQTQINNISTGGVNPPSAVRYSGGTGSTDPFQTILPAGSAVLFYQESSQTADIEYNATTGVFTVAKSGIYDISFDAEVVIQATADFLGEVEGYVSIGTPTALTPKYGRIRIAVPDSFAIPGLPAWPIAVTTQLSLAVGDTFSCILGLYGAVSGIIPGVGAVAPLDTNPGQANFSCVRVGTIA